jgi:hypothetical protein
MIAFTKEHGFLRVAQEIWPPSVYLDHWALREISESPSLARRLTNAIHLRNGTLVLSWLKVVEFSKVSDPAQRRKADALPNSLGRRLFWLNPDFWTVAKHESDSHAQGLRDYTHSDTQFAANFVVTGLEHSDSPSTLGPQHLFDMVPDVPDIQKNYDALADLILESVKSLREDTKVAKALRRKPRAPQTIPAPRDTQLIARELVGRFLKDKLMKLNRNNAIDLSHAVVSVSYCDYALLDTHWAAIVNQARERIAAAGHSINIAKVFSKRGNGVEEFLNELEDGASASAT